MDGMDGWVHECHSSILATVSWAHFAVPGEKQLAPFREPAESLLHHREEGLQRDATSLDAKGYSQLRCKEVNGKPLINTGRKKKGGGTNDFGRVQSLAFENAFGCFARLRKSTPCLGKIEGNDALG